MNIDNTNLGGITPCSICGQFGTLQNPCSCAIGWCTKDCLGRSQTKCKSCGKYHSVFEKCLCMREVQVTPTVESAKPSENLLEELYNELGTLKWAGSEMGWDLAISAVRKHIAGKLK